MAAKFFSKFPKRYYDTKGDAVLRVVTDFFRYVDVNEMLIDSSAGAYTLTEIQDGERPDVLSFRLYGTSDYYWSFFILNDSLKEGINHSWPLSSSEIEESLASEYDPYSVLTFLPAYSEGTDGRVSSGNTFSGVPLPDTVLPYIRLETTSIVPGAPVKTSKVMKWDDTLMQLWVYDSTGDISSTTSFKLGWNNPFEEDSDEWIANEALREAYIDELLGVFAQSDPAGYASFQDILSDAEPEEVEEVRYAYTFGKIYTRSHFWSSARNAAAWFYDPLDETNILTAIDAAGSTNFVSNFEAETALNSQKAKIRVVNKDSIAAFAEQYFSTLTS